MAAPEVAKDFRQQIVETEHLLRALLEQPNGLARRVLSKVRKGGHVVWHVCLCTREGLL